MGCVGFVEKIRGKINQCQLGCGGRVLKTRDKDDPPGSRSEEQRQHRKSHWVMKKQGLKARVIKETLSRGK